MTLSDFDLMRHVRLPNWGRCGWDVDEIPNPNSVCAGIYRRGKTDPNKSVVVTYKCFPCRGVELQDPGRCNACGGPLSRLEERIPDEPPPPNLDHESAAKIDALLKLVSPAHVMVVRRHFYLLDFQRREEVDAAVRALLDAEEVALERVA